MTNPAQAMPIRKLEFGFTGDLDRFFYRHDPVLSYGAHAYWMTMPYLEPYLMRTVRAAMAEVKDSTLREEMRRFCAQEGQHYQQHARVNDILRRQLPEADGALREIETALDADYKRFTAERDHAFNLAYAEAFESMTMAMSRTQMELGVQDLMAPPIRDLFLWHITEEMEHRTVAFDAYTALGKGWWYRVKTGHWAQRHYLGYVQRFLACFLTHDAARVAALETPEMIAERKRLATAFNRRNSPRLLATWMPWYHPRRVKLPAAFEAARAAYSERAISIG